MNMTTRVRTLFGNAPRRTVLAGSLLMAITLGACGGASKPNAAAGADFKESDRGTLRRVGSHRNRGYSTCCWEAGSLTKDTPSATIEWP